MSSEFVAAEPEVAEDVASPATEVTEDSSDDAILDAYTKGDTEKAPAEEPATKEVVAEEAKPAVEAKVEKAEEKLPDERLDPQELKQVFKRYPALRQEHYTLAAYRDVFPDIKEARELRQVFPTKEEATEARGAAERLLSLDSEFRSNPAGFVRELATADPSAFYKLASQFSSEVYNLDPKAYDAYFIKPVINEFSTQFRDYAKGNNDEELIAALDVIDQRLGRNPNAKPAPATDDNDPRFAKLREYERAEQERTAQGSERFYYSAGDAVKDTVTKEVIDIVDRAGATLSDGAKREIANRVITKVGDVLSSDNYLQQRIRFFARAGKADDPQLRDSVVRLMMTKARTILRDETQEQINWMTRDILSLQEPKKAAAITRRRDVGDGGQATPGAKARPKDTSRMTPDEIMDAFSKD